MRARAHLSERLAECANLTLDSFGAGAEFTSSDAPLYIEIGCGKGSFILQNALLHPENRYIAIEKVANVAVLAMEKAAAAEVANLRFMVGNFADLSIGFPDKSVDCIFLNFSDPWPKKGYARRRLTHGGFLSIYKRILKPGGCILFKTDNRALFDFSLESFPESGFKLSDITYDLHSDGIENNIMTEYERKFSAEGIPICRLRAQLSE